MAQEFTINSSAIEAKINQLLPSQGGSGAGVDFSASTMVIPIVDLTESAEGSSLRPDLQTATDFATSFTQVINAANTVILNTTGFYKVSVTSDGINSNAQINLFDGTTSKIIKYYAFGSDSNIIVDQFVIFLSAGLSLRATSSASSVAIQVHTRQIADITGNLTNPVGF
jgi:hypothetical protein